MAAATQIAAPAHMLEVVFRDSDRPPPVLVLLKWPLSGKFKRPSGTCQPWTLRHGFFQGELVVLEKIATDWAFR